MSQHRIGELLCRMVPLSGHDIDEILQEQRITPKRFGEVAIALGMCRPEHVWQAWANQQSDSLQHIDLDEVGIDSQTTGLLPSGTVRQFRCLPVRLAGDQLIVAVSETGFAGTDEVRAMLGDRVKFVIAPDQQISRMIDHYYPA